MKQLRKKKFESSLIGLRRRELNYVYKDIICPVLVRNTGAGRPVLATFIGNIQAYQLPVDSWFEFEVVEIPHDWVEGSELEFHVHWATGGDNDATPRGARFELEYAITNIRGVFVNSTVKDAETEITANESFRQLKYTVVEKLNWDQGKIGAQLIMRLKRIASADTAPANNPFVFQLGIHYLCDALGSKTKAAK